MGSMIQNQIKQGETLSTLVACVEIVKEVKVRNVIKVEIEIEAEHGNIENFQFIGNVWRKSCGSPLL